MKLSDFDFVLPEDRIATRPANPRPSARLLLAEGDQAERQHVVQQAHDQKGENQAEAQFDQGA